MTILDFIRQPWPWYVAGPLIGLTVPVLLLIGNKSLGVSSSLRHLCAACVPANLSYFRYDWKRERWNLFFVVGILLGGLVATQGLSDGEPPLLAASLVTYLQGHGIHDFSGLLPAELFSPAQLFTAKGLIFYVLGGFLVGFGTRWAGGCTSGHSIMGLSTLQWPSLVATVSFMVGGFIMTNLVLPQVLDWLNQ